MPPKGHKRKKESDDDSGAAAATAGYDQDDPFLPATEPKTPKHKGDGFADAFKKRPESKKEHDQPRGCGTDKPGNPKPPGNPTALVVDASDGFIPLWARNQQLRYKMNMESISAYFANPEAAADAIEELFLDAVAKWDVPVIEFVRNDQTWDFDIVMLPRDNGKNTLASAFFPDPGRNHVYMYPLLFNGNTRDYIVNVFVHEIGHIYGLRHFFALVSEREWPARIFGTHQRKTIMNYGADSVLTKVDQRDLRALYNEFWAGRLREIQGTLFTPVKPYHTLADHSWWF